MEHKPIYPEIRPENVALPKGQDLAGWLNSRIARYETRSLDWHALKFQAYYDQKYRRAQMRYIGTGGTGVEGDDNAVPAEHFTFSTMVLPAGCEGPLHLHTDAEEVFFVLRGNLMVFVEDEKGRRVTRNLGPWECISCPAGVIHGYQNESVEPVYFQVMLGRGRPETMGYADDNLYKRRDAHLKA